VPIVAASLALTLAACGGDDGGGSDVQPAAGVEGAEQTVHDYLAALAAGDGSAACGYFSDEWAAGIVAQNQEAADQLGATDCASFVEALHDRGSISIGGQELTPEVVDELDLRTDAKVDLTDPENPDQQSATVHAEDQVYELEVIDGTWKITRLS
jgi:hypothetical protein